MTFYGNRAFQEPWELPELRYRELVFKTSQIISVVMTLVAILMFAVFLVQHSRIRALEAALEDHIERGDRLRGHILWMNGELDESPIVVRAAQLGFHLHQ